MRNRGKGRKHGLVDFLYLMKHVKASINGITTNDEKKEDSKSLTPF